MSENYQQTGAQLDEDLAALTERVESTETAIAELGTTVEEIANREGAGSTPALEDELAEIRQSRQELQLVSSPAHTRTLASGSHDDEAFHTTRDGNGIGAWGIVVTAEADAHWRGADVHAREAGSMLLEVFAMDYEASETYDVGSRIATREITLEEGRQTIYPDVTVHEGQQYFITRDTANPTGDDVVALKRGRQIADWNAINDPEVPLTAECSWQLGRAGPGSQAFADYQDAGWDAILHHWTNIDLGFDDLVED
ncbi:hypothetical protein [Halalkalicoccus jeotgali]|uniref:Uncharacterized protein n=1 Tax=Halalkalicoccus jeotgali (strain DSM 18796 / CECT 7217 / JCM 14584 / KCTC 4019 / B3) TaxID=795797 RepID=D8J9P1_HALJB|nr:hypothetical protein [Halalkalicoccus jeotgali]ADJ14453.1 hypothetical protein HacjB3_05310 [Halalkalicoccus jeotgali B3]ELY40167.1 hypothetical protein C497_03685 [Halalkalicoccus jeotgali B3]